MKRQSLTIIMLSLLLCSAYEARSQSGKGPADNSALYPRALLAPPPSIGIKTNLLYDMTTTMNLGLEIKLGMRSTLDVSANYNPWNFGGNKKIKHFLVQPEFRYWICESFSGHFFGIHGIYGQYNVGGVLGIGDKRHQGDAYGGGISYGYQWYLSPRFNLEATIGVGYLYLDNKTYECGDCGREIESKARHYFGPTKAGVSLIYIIK